MGKISQVASKYIVHASIEIDGVVDRPDIIGAVFGQTEGLLGSELELRELQRSGRIGRIEVNTAVKNGKAGGNIVVPSSLDKAETAIIGASLEIIQRIGPCNARVRVLRIEDVRVSKRKYVLDRAKQLLRTLVDGVIPDSQELALEVSQSVRVMEIVEYGQERLPAGPMIEESEDVIVVEGRADVLNLLKHGFKNAIALNGTSCPQTVIDLSKRKELTVFVDGDRGGDLIIKELLQVAEIDFVTKAPDGKEVEEITKKEIHKALRSRVTMEQIKQEFSQQVHSLKRKQMISPVEDVRPQENGRHAMMSAAVSPMTSAMTPAMNPAPAMTPASSASAEGGFKRREVRAIHPRPMVGKPMPSAGPSPSRLSVDERKKFGVMLESLVGTRGAYLVDEKQNILGRVPLSELEGAIKSLKGSVYAVLFDGVAGEEIVRLSEEAGVKHMVAMESKIKPADAGVNIIVAEAL